RRLADGSAVLAVADGVGGYPGGEVALAIEAVAAVLEAAPPDADPAELLVAATREADRRVRAGQTGPHALMCTTLVAALVREGLAWIANVGDSRAYHCSAGALTQITRDHSWVEEEIAAGRLRRDDPRVEARRNIVTRVVGGESAEADSFGPLALAHGDALLLCSDGLHGYVPDSAIALALTPPDARATDRLIALSLERGGVDNVTVAICATE
ncbi:MAG: protein phosphatase 2C domain-containing protein, partial [Chloroflexi bacterium]|nr:protein phosphatase 2C domain-containing protein [Chloroflexota bacterium]